MNCIIKGSNHTYIPIPYTLYPIPVGLGKAVLVGVEVMRVRKEQSGPEAYHCSTYTVVSDGFYGPRSLHPFPIPYTLYPVGL